MQRRKLLRNSATALTAAAGGVLASSCTIRKESTERTSGIAQVRWRMATSWPISLDTIYGGAETICQRINEISKKCPNKYFIAYRRPFTLAANLRQSTRSLT